MSNADIDVLVLRTGTEGLSMRSYAEAIRQRLPDYSVVHAKTPYEEREFIRNARVATGYSVGGDVVENAGSLELFVVAASGYNHLPMDLFEEYGTVVANGAGIHAPGIAEQALGSCLMFARSMHVGWQRKQRREWRHYEAGEFTGSTVTVVGMGAIGQAFVERLEGMGVDTIGVRYTPSKGGPTDEVIGFDEREFHDALARTDYLVLATPLSETTRNLIGREELRTLDPHAVLVNVSRGGIVDTEALVGALQNDDIRGAALDVTDPEPLPADHVLWRLGNVLLTPHMGGCTPRHWDRLADVLVENVRALDDPNVTTFRNRVSALDY